MARTNGFLISAKIFVPHDPSNLDGAAETIAAIKAADGKDLSQLAAVGGIVLETSRKFTSKDLDDPASDDAAALAEAVSPAAPAPSLVEEIVGDDPGPADTTGKKSRRAS